MNELITENNYIFIPNFISPQRATELANRFIKFCKDNNLDGDSQIPESHSVYNYVDFLELLCEKTPEVSKFLGETVLPTYTYARVYKQGATLDRHRDREACEISLTIHLTGDSEWPIYIQKPNGEEVELNLATGDAMMYRGNIADHWRNRFEGREYVQVFMHYVRSRGENNWAFFDRDRFKPAEPKLFMDNSLAQEPVAETKPAIQHSSDSLSDYIQVFDNIVPDDLCQEILAEYAPNGSWKATQVAGGVTDRNVRNVDSIGLSLPENTTYSAKRKWLDDELFKCAALAIRKYNDVFPEAHIEQDSGYELLRYQTGQFYKQHTDSFKLHPRAVSCSFALNDDYDGGEWGFWNQKSVLKVKKGSVIMFPSNFMYPHEIMPVTKGTRYSIITWFI